MTLYSGSDWSPPEPIPELLPGRMARMLWYNRQKERWQPGAFTLHTAGDVAYVVVARTLDLWGKKLDSPEAIEDFVQFVDEAIDATVTEDKPLFIELCRKVGAALLEPENQVKKP